MHDAFPLHNAKRQAGDALHLHLRAHVPVDGGQIRPAVSGSSARPQHRRSDTAGHCRKETDRNGS
jgi:hypothetical protein